MDRLQRQPCHKLFNNYEEQNISLKEKCDEVLASSELNGFKQSELSVNCGADSLYLYKKDDIGDGEPNPQQNIDSQLTEENLNFEFMNTSNKNVVIKSSFEPQINATQQQNDLTKLNVSEAKGDEIVIDSFASGISGSLGESQSMITKTISTNLSTHHSIEKFTTTLHEQSEKQSFKSSSHALNEEYKANSDVGDRDEILNSRMTESYEGICKERLLYSSNIYVTNGPSRNSEFIYGQKCDENYEARQNQNPSEKKYDVCDKRENEFTNIYEPFRTENGLHKIPGNSGMRSDAQAHPKDKRFVCPFCGKGFRHKCLLVIHNRQRTGEKPYICDKCGKRYVTKYILKAHLLIHTGEKNFACHICESRFLRKEQVTSHVLTHTGEKPHKCFMCAKAYTNKSNLRRHQNLAHNIKFGRKVCKEIQKP